jgi:hypothetical protein
MVRDEKATLFDSLRRNWDTVWQTAVWVGSAAFLTLASPPRFLGSELPSNSIVKASELTLAVCVGFCLYLFRAKNRIDKSRYAYSAATFLAFGIILFLLYQFEFDAWTCSFDGRGPVTIGTSLLPEAAAYTLAHPEADCEYLLQISAGKPDRIWPKNEIVFHHLAMFATFLSSVLSLALAVLLMTFAITEHAKERIQK